MILAGTLLALALSPPAAADTIIIQKSGPFHVFAWVDGQPQGTIKGKRQLHIEVAPGQHEVWIATEDSGTVTSCHGTIEVQGTALVAARSQTCDGLSAGVSAQDSLFAGTMAAFDMTAGPGAWVSVDGGPALVMPAIPLELNLAPGPHRLILYRDEAMTAVLAEGQVDLQPGQSAAITCTDTGCEGWAVPTVPVEGDAAGS